jgi:hypothetical protein
MSATLPTELAWHSPSFDRPVSLRRLLVVLAVIAVGCGAYGFTIGAWRGVELGSYVAIKFPLLMMLTVACNGLLNGIFAQLLGSGLGFRQTAQAILESYAIFAIVLGCLSPLSSGLAWNLTTTGPENVMRAHASLLCFHMVVIAYAGLIAHLRMLRGLKSATGSSGVATRTFLAWSLGNLIAGAQIGYVLRPYAVTPGLPIEFLRRHPLDGNFYLTMWASAVRLSGGHPRLTALALLVLITIGALWLWRAMRRELQDSSPIHS